VRLSYPLLCTLVGIVVGSLPRLVHGPIQEKFDVLFLQGAVAVWGWYVARCSIGLLVGITRWPERWWLRGPLCGALLLVPLCFVSLATPGCGPPCAAVNLASAAVVGLLVGGIAFLVTGRQRW
jgi:hypothetical protein